MTDKDLESKVEKIAVEIKEIRTYIENCEKIKEDKWKAGIDKKLENIEKHLSQQNTNGEKDRRLSDGKMWILSGLPVFAVGLGLFLYGWLNIDDYLKSALGSIEFYMCVIGGLIVLLGFYLASSCNKGKCQKPSD